MHDDGEERNAMPARSSPRAGVPGTGIVPGIVPGGSQTQSSSRLRPMYAAEAAAKVREAAVTGEQIDGILTTKLSFAIREVRVARRHAAMRVTCDSLRRLDVF